MTRDELRDMMAMAREQRAKRVKLVTGTYEVEFDLGYDEKQSRPSLTEDELKSLKPMCPGGCGHPTYDHRDYGCIHGCSPQKCIPNPPALPE